MVAAHSNKGVKLFERADITGTEIFCQFCLIKIYNDPEGESAVDMHFLA